MTDSTRRTDQDEQEDTEQEIAPGERDEAVSQRKNSIRWTGLLIGVIAAGLMYLVLPGDLAHAAKMTAATAVLMAIWWMTEALPIPATALVPLVVFPLAVGDVGVDDVGASYGNNIIFLFMGGFMLALAMQRWNLHRRIALLTVRAMGTKPTMVVAGFMIATAFISLWVSNTATAVMMLPIGISVLVLVTNLESEDEDLAEQVKSSNFGTALMLGIAYAASLGSLGSIISTPPNTLLVGYMDANHDVQIGFAQWLAVGGPLSLVFLVFCWWLLTKVLFKPEIEEIPGGREMLSEELDKLGPMSSGEWRVLAIFVLAAIGWVALPLVFDDPPLDDAGVAMVVALLLFILPAGAARGVRLLDWESAVALPWGVLLLFGGGLALSAQFTDSGLTEWIGEQAGGLGVVPVVLVVLIVAAGVLALTELTSNTATAATFLPLAGGVAVGLGLDPLLLTIPVAIAATCAFMLPVATPPNAIAFGSGYVTIGQMIKGGFWLNMFGIVAITLTTMTLAVWIFGIAY